MFGHPGVGEGDVGKIGLGDVAQLGREDQVGGAAVAGLGEFGIAGFGLCHGGIGAGRDDVKYAARHFGAGETGFVIRETFIYLIDGRGVAADDADAVAFLPGQMKACPLFRNAESRLGERSFRQ